MGESEWFYGLVYLKHRQFMKGCFKEKNVRYHYLYLLFAINFQETQKLQIVCSLLLRIVSFCESYYARIFFPIIMLMYNYDCYNLILL